MYPAVKKMKKYSSPIQIRGLVVGTGPEGIRVDTEEGVLLAKKAFSCLIEPVEGDRVLVAGDLNDGVHVIAVLERTGDAPATMAFDRDLTLGVLKGRLGFAAGRGIDLVSAKDMNLTSSELSVRAQRSHVFLDRLSYVGSRLIAEVGAVRLVGEIFDAVLERISRRVKRSYTVVEDLDHVRSGQMDYRAVDTMSLRAKNAIVTAEELIKMDGDQIHLG